MSDRLLRGWRRTRPATVRLPQGPELIATAAAGHTGHHAFLCQMMLDRIDSITQRAAELTTRIEEQIAPFAGAADRLDEIPGVGRTGAQELIAEIGADMTRFPDAAHLVSWAKFAPIDRTSAKKKGASTGKGNPWLGTIIGEIVSGAARTDTFLAERYQRIARRREKRRAIVAVGNSVLTIIWHLLDDPDASYHDLGPRLLRITPQQPVPPAHPHPPARAAHRPGSHPSASRLTHLLQPPTGSATASPVRCRASLLTIFES
jgi:transposase